MAISLLPESTRDGFMKQLEAAYQIYTGSYTGDGGDNRDLGGVGFQPDLVHIFPAEAGTSNASHWTATPGGDATEVFEAEGTQTDVVQSVGADGFQIGAGLRANADGVLFYFVCFKMDADDSEYGTYEGDGNDNRDISFTNSWQAEFIVTQDIDQARIAGWNSESHGGDLTSTFDNADPGANRIQSISTAGQFQVGTGGISNANGNTYIYYAFKEQTTAMESGSYTADGTDPTSISVGFEPEYVWVKKGAVGAGRIPVARTTENPTDECFRFQGEAQITDGIEAFESDGFVIGASVTVNESTSSPTYYWVAWKTPAAGGAPQDVDFVPQFMGLTMYEPDELYQSYRTEGM